MNTTIFETAKALRDAGFPQPFPAFGQQWYFPETKELFLVTFVYSNGKVDYCMEGSQVVMLEDMPEGSIFAPQAHDILRELDGEYHLSIDYSAEGESFVYEERQVFFGDGFAGVVIAQFGEPHSSPHEVAAKSYLQLHKPA